MRYRYGCDCPLSVWLRSVRYCSEIRVRKKIRVLALPQGASELSGELLKTCNDSETMTIDPTPTAANPAARVGVLVTCLIDLLRPEAGFATTELLEQAGCCVEVPVQGCCGQPNFNGGDAAGARAMARAVMEVFTGFDYVVVPSGSCAAMLKVHYPTLFAADSDDYLAACDLAAKTWELTAFLHDVVDFQAVAGEFAGEVAVHDSCSALRDLGIAEQPRALVAQVRGCGQQALQNPDVCCGFGGLFCVKYPAISERMAEKKTADIVTTTRPVAALVSTDLGCLLHLAGKLRRDGVELEALHIAELLVRRPAAESGA